ncbi:hypothetical protein EDB89DRAFT_1911292 [Lactarius sanguifluus]|nr:hypothetical protein EDB89DRAFT_1911292 [Lactarius sanguifluus]
MDQESTRKALSPQSVTRKKWVSARAYLSISSSSGLRDGVRRSGGTIGSRNVPDAPILELVSFTVTQYLSIFNFALKAYEKKTKKDLLAHPLAAQLQFCSPPADILVVLQDKVKELNQSRSADERLSRWLNPTIDVLYAFSATLGEGVGLVFSLAKVISAGAGVLLSAAKDVEASQDALIDLFERIENFFKRLESYTSLRPERYLKKLIGKKEIEDALKRLDKLTQEEARMAAAEILKLMHIVDDKVTTVVNGVQHLANSIDDGIKCERASDDGLLRQIRRQITISPAVSNTEERLSGSFGAEFWGIGDALALFCGFMANRGPGRASFGQSSLSTLHYSQLTLPDSSAIIQDIQTLRKAGLASIAYFYFDFRDLDKQNRRNLLPSLLVQLSTQSGPRCDILHRLYLEHEKGSQAPSRPSEAALIQCLKDMLTIPNQPPIYIILDALDECPNSRGIPSPREEVLTLVKDLVNLRLPHLHICVTSRPEFDIRATLGPLALHAVSLHDESGQKKDIADYVHSVVYSDSETMMKKWREGDKKMVIEALSEKADGISDLYQRVMMDIKKANQVHAYRMLQCLTVAVRPLSVAELAELLAFDFDVAKGGIPELNLDWRREDHEQAVLSTCSSLITVVPGRGSRPPVVQFSHFSVKEFLMSDRLATSSGDISQYYIFLEDSHTVLAQACLGVLLRVPMSKMAPILHLWLDMPLSSG